MPREKPSFQPVKPSRKDLSSYENGPLRLPTQLERLTPEQAIPMAIALLRKRVKDVQAAAQYKEEIGVAGATFMNVSDPTELAAKQEQMTDRREQARVLREEIAVLEEGIQALEHDGMPSSEFIAHVTQLLEKEARTLFHMTKDSVPPPGEDGYIDNARANVGAYQVLLNSIEATGKAS